MALAVPAWGACEVACSDAAPAVVWVSSAAAATSPALCGEVRGYARTCSDGVCVLSRCRAGVLAGEWAYVAPVSDVVACSSAHYGRIAWLSARARRGPRDRPTLLLEPLSAEAAPAAPRAAVEALAAALSDVSAPAGVLAIVFEGESGEVLQASAGSLRAWLSAATSAAASADLLDSGWLMLMVWDTAHGAVHVARWRRESG